MDFGKDRIRHSLQTKSRAFWLSCCELIRRTTRRPWLRGQAIAAVVRLDRLRGYTQRRCPRAMSAGLFQRPVVVLGLHLLMVSRFSHAPRVLDVIVIALVAERTPAAIHQAASTHQDSAIGATAYSRLAARLKVGRPASRVFNPAARHIGSPRRRLNRRHASLVPVRGAALVQTIRAAQPSESSGDF